MNDLSEILSTSEAQIKGEWIKGMEKAVQRTDLISRSELEEQCRSLLNAVVSRVKTAVHRYRQWRRLGFGTRSVAGYLNDAGSPGFLSQRGSNVCALDEAAYVFGDTARTVGQPGQAFRHRLDRNRNCSIAWP